MSVERREDGSITIRSSSGVAVIAQVTGVINDKSEAKFQEWVEDCAKLITANSHTFEETERYFLQQCDVLPLSQDDRRMKNFQCNLIMNYYKDKLKHQISEFSFDMTDDEIEKWHKVQNAMREEALNSPPERFGLIMRGYCLPYIERNAVYYDQARQNWEKHTKNSSTHSANVVNQDICFYFEETTEHLQVTGGENDLLQELIIFRGVSEDDIRERNPKFLGYITTLRDIGKLDFMK